MNSTDTLPVTGAQPRRPAKRWRKVALALFVTLLVWLIVDLYAPRQTSLRAFDAAAVAHLETAMWRSYYDKERLALFNQLAELLRQQYRMPLARSYVTAYHAARAAFVFKEGKERADYLKALPNLVSYYAAINAMSDAKFDVPRVAQLELEWWIVHRQRAQHQPGDLDKALAELQSAIYQMPVERFAEHARLRTEAMDICDQKTEVNGATQADWQRIDQLLTDSWSSLLQAVQ
jgi:tetratricopeptide (TPR) repeat protein